MTDLLISVRSLTGTFHGVGNGDVPEWPPSPYRLFQALLAGASDGRTSAGDNAVAEAFRWLERQDPPDIHAPESRRLAPVTLFVPNNDIDAFGGDPARAGDMRAAKRIQAQSFDRHEAFHYLWRDVEDPVPDRLRGIVERLHTLGHGMDAAFARMEVAETIDRTGGAPSRFRHVPGVEESRRGLAVPRIGTYASLEQRHRGFVERLRQRGKAIEFVQPTAARHGRRTYGMAPKRFVFRLCHPIARERFLPFEPTMASRLVREALDVIKESFSDGGDTVERFVLGIGARSSDVDRRVRLIPLPSRGSDQADGRIRRLLVEVPQSSPVRPEAVAWALDGTNLLGATLALDTQDPWETLRRLGSGRRSRLWRTSTPIVLPNDERARRARRAEMDGSTRIAIEKAEAHALRDALRHAGVDARLVSCRLQREPFEGSARPAREYAVGSRFDDSRLRHVEIRLDRPVRGPLILGDGRFLGLGLLEGRLVAEARHWAFMFDKPFPAAERERVLRQVRRAVIARFQVRIGAARELPTLISGHGVDGGPARAGRHDHLYFRAMLDGEGELCGFEVLMPQLVDRTARAGQPRTVSALADCLVDMRVLRLPRMSRALRAVEPPSDASATEFASVTSYVSTRRPRRGCDLPAFVAADASTQVRSLGLPNPNTVTARRCVVRTDGLVVASLKLSFATPVIGPILIGQDAHFGGGDLRETSP